MGEGGVVVAAHFFHCYYYFIITHCSLRANVSPQYPPTPNPAAFQVVSFRGGQQPPPTRRRCLAHYKPTVHLILLPGGVWHLLPPPTTPDS